eukprot:COSAG01_NODE_3655_length_5822_cov_7.778438_5_plen_299_part_00
MTACSAEQTGGSSRWRAILVAGENVEQATSDCLLACLVFEDTETGARCRIGCDTSCDNHFGCTHPSQLGGVRHCCEFVTQVSGRQHDVSSFTGYVHSEPVPSVLTRSISARDAIRIMAANFAAPLGLERWWEELPEKLTHYRMCKHTFNMLEKLDPERPKLRSTLTGIFNPKTKKYEEIAEKREAKPRGAKNHELCVNSKCTQGADGGRKKKPKKKGDKSRFKKGYCPLCYDMMRAADIAKKAKVNQPGDKPVLSAYMCGFMQINSAGWPRSTPPPPLSSSRRRRRRRRGRGKQGQEE